MFLKKRAHNASLQPGNCKAISAECLHHLTRTELSLSLSLSALMEAIEAGRRADQRLLVEGRGERRGVGAVFQSSQRVTGLHRACIHPMKMAFPL